MGAVSWPVTIKRLIYGMREAAEGCPALPLLVEKGFGRRCVSWGPDERGEEVVDDMTGNCIF